jgi:hypothetical protein
MWPLATSGSKQPRSWRLVGFDFEQHMANVFGPRLRKPLTKHHGAQVEAVFKRQDEIWAAEPLATGLRELGRDAEVAAFVENLEKSVENRGKSAGSIQGSVYRAQTDQPTEG